MGVVVPPLPAAGVIDGMPALISVARRADRVPCAVSVTKLLVRLAMNSQNLPCFQAQSTARNASDSKKEKRKGTHC